MSELDALLARHTSESQRIDAAGGRAVQARQQRLGRMLARQRVEALLDAGSFVEIGRHHMTSISTDDPRAAASPPPPGDGIICGMGTLEGHTIAVCAHDPTVLRGAVGAAGARKLIQLLKLAIQQRVPLITLADSDGARIAEGVDAISGWSEVMGLTVKHRKLAPHLTAAMGLCVGAVAYNAMLADLLVMVEPHSFMFITGPSVTQTVTGEPCDIEALGGARLHADITGAAQAAVPDEPAAIDWIKRALRYTLSPALPCDDDPLRATPRLLKDIPAAPRRAYDMRKVLAEVFDVGSLFELSETFGSSLITALGRLGGRSVMILASQPMQRSGCLDIDSSKKGARALEYANTHKLPVLTLVDTSGYMPGLQQERGGILIEGARLLRAYAELDVPTISVTLRKSYGGANVLAGASQLKLALPTAQIAPMGEDAAVMVMLGPPRADDADDAAAREALRQTWRQTHGDAWLAAERGFFDAIIHPEAMRAELWRALRVLQPQP